LRSTDYRCKINHSYIELVDGIHVGSEVGSSGHSGQSAGEKVVVVDVLNDEEETLETSVGLSEELGVAHQLADGDISEFGEQGLERRMDLEMPTNLIINLVYRLNLT